MMLMLLPILGEIIIIDNVTTIFRYSHDLLGLVWVLFVAKCFLLLHFLLH